MTLLPVAEAQARLFALGKCVETENIALDHAAGRFLATDILALRTQPVADLSAMDGYAIKFADMPGPWNVIGESAAGGGFDGVVNSGQTVRIFTGAPLPSGTDTILMQEDVAAAPLASNTASGTEQPQIKTIRLINDGPNLRATHVRALGSDFNTGDTLLAAGNRVTPGYIALAAMAGHGHLPVSRRIKVAILSTGNELRQPGTALFGAQIPASNGIMLRAMLHDFPVDIMDGGIIPDDMNLIQNALRSAEQQGADIIVTTGGASVGDHDLILPALTAMNAPPDFWRIAMKPGKPLMAGRLGQAIMLGLPGNPVSAFVTATLFLKPLVAALSGATNPLPVLTIATCKDILPATFGRAEYLRGIYENGAVRLATNQDSAALLALAHANALILRPAHAPASPAGKSVNIITLA